MSYQALARTWRPQTFAEVVGQPHVVQAISNGIAQQRLHHAFLFSGTRGVGKTTIARLLAKSLNCEQGPTPTPCGVCSACIEVKQGNFVDLIEIDAASRTKVEDTRELLENVQYRPTRGRYKVYLIDEVHMLSKHSFNALLKTLEEPPPHVKFLLATTDPQKLPITILSRCLQFNLRSLSVDEISNHLRSVLSAEQIPFDNDALIEIARAARGSMRDALSLTDQAVAHGNGSAAYLTVCQMLGTVQREQLTQLLAAIVKGDGSAAMAQVDHLAQYSPDFDKLLSELSDALHRIAMLQQIGMDDSIAQSALWQGLPELAGGIAPEMVQLYYRFMVEGRRELPLSPDPRVALEMTLLRCLSFRPKGTEQGVEPNKSVSTLSAHADSVVTSSAEPGGETPVAIVESSANKTTPKPVEPLNRPSDLPVLDPQPQAVADEPEKPPQQPHGSSVPAVTSAEAGSSVGVSHDEVEASPASVTVPLVVAPAVIEHSATDNHAETDNQSGDEEQWSSSDSAALSMQDALVREQEHIMLTATEHGYSGSQQTSAQQTAVQDVAIQDAPAPHSDVQSGAGKAIAARNILRSHKLNLERSGKKPKGLGATSPNPVMLNRAQPSETSQQEITSQQQAVNENTADADSGGQSSIPTNSVNQAASVPVTADSVSKKAPSKRKLLPTDDVWSKLIELCELGGIVRQLAINSVLIEQGDVWRLGLVAEQKHLATERLQAQLVEALSDLSGQRISLVIDLAQEDADETPRQIQQRLKNELLERTKQIINADLNVQFFVEQFDASVDDDSIKPLT
ncbi:DNA polymerase III subunit gamma/tau [Corallincola spongiicola]|uniref:DNA polymerase III subunit gamma/tau n=1 Tax=Corallincola spongiicola TaxID=2520508 RepID=A0ABY1WSV0_9GAMM|nr:DNA polymerase III subunit gamma/tau [Corallincola spongiicola]TAA47708.1 DNA polymerase III subunit gamma/tau [Corallincola spongiicola]